MPSLLETESVILSAPAATLRLIVPRGWKCGVYENAAGEWAAESPGDNYTLYIKLDPMPASHRCRTKK